MEYLRIAVDLLKALAWPALALYVLAVYREPIRRLVLIVPAKLEQTSKVSIGSLVVEMQTTLANIGDPELANELPHLSRSAYEQLLSMQNEDAVLTLVTFSGTADEHGILLPSSEEIEVARELTRMGLIESSEPLEEFIQFIEVLPQSPTPYDGGTWILRDSLSEIDYQRIVVHSCKITPRGQRLYEVLIGVILSTLTKDRPTDPNVRS